MIKNLESLLFLMTESPDIIFKYSTGGNSIKIIAAQCNVEIKGNEKDINFCEINFNYMSREVNTAFKSKSSLTQSVICEISKIDNFLTYCYEQLNLTTKHNKLHVEESGTNNFIKKQKEILNILNDNHPDYTVTVIRGSHQDFNIKAMNKNGYNLLIDFESQFLSKEINFGALQARIVIDGPVLDGFDMFIPFKDIPKYKLLKSDLYQYIPNMSEQDTANNILGKLAKELDFFEKIKFKNNLDTSLEIKSPESNRKPKI